VENEEIEQTGTKEGRWMDKWIVSFGIFHFDILEEWDENQND